MAVSQPNKRDYGCGKRLLFADWLSVSKSAEIRKLLSHSKVGIKPKKNYEKQKQHKNERLKIGFPLLSLYLYIRYKK